MNLVTNSWLRLRWLLPVWLPVGLWAMLWFSISSGSPAGVLNPGSPIGFAQGLRALFPLAAAGAAFTFGFMVIPQRARTFGLLGPLGLTTAYGVAGLVASLNSPDGSVALWWTALYLSVPVVLWGVTRGADPLDQIRRLIGATWLVIIIATTALFVVALLYLDLVDKLLNPTLLLQCQPAQWFDLTGQKLRGTGVGRYAAIMGLIAISGLWQGRWRPVWLAGLLASVALLVYTGARGSFGGFAAGASLILLSYLVHAGKRVLLPALLAMLVLLPLVWSTGVHRGFLDRCVFQGSDPTAIFSTIGSLIIPLVVSESVDSQPSEADNSIKEKPAEPGDPATASAAQAATEEVVPGTSLPGSPDPTAEVSAAEVVPGTSIGVRPDPTAQAPAAEVVPGTSLPGSPDPTAEVPAAEAVPGTSIGVRPDPTAQAPEAEVVSGTSLPGSPDPTAQAPEAEMVSGTSLPGSPDPTAETPEANSGSDPPLPKELIAQAKKPQTANRFLQFSGRTAVWVEGWRLIKSSPLIGFGFHADRLLLGTHMHNSILHALLQAGFVGAIFFVAAMMLAWILFFRIIIKPALLSGAQRHLVIQCGGVLAFLTVRSLPESTGAFFGVDWLILAPILYYLQLVNDRRRPQEVNGDDSKPKRT